MSTKEAILIVGNPSGFCEFMESNFPEYEIIKAATGFAGLENCKKSGARVVVIDSILSDVSAEKLIKRISEDFPDKFLIPVDNKNHLNLPEDQPVITKPYNKKLLGDLIQASLNRKTCLIVDDIAFNRKMVKPILTKLGFKVEEADKATDIGKFFDRNYKNKIDVILIDWHMPEIKGSTFIEIIKGSKFSSVPIFLYSATEDEKEIKNLAMKSGFAGFLPKNLNLETLKNEFVKANIIRV